MRQRDALLLDAVAGKISPAMRVERTSQDNVARAEQFDLKWRGGSLAVEKNDGDQLRGIAWALEIEMVVSIAHGCQIELHHARRCLPQKFRHIERDGDLRLGIIFQRQVDRDGLGGEIGPDALNNGVGRCGLCRGDFRR